MQPQQIGRYQIKTELGRGGMSTVYLAHDPQFDRDVAIKVQPREFLHDPTFLERFSQEAQVIARLEHRNILPVYDFGEADGLPYIVMRYMPHGSLRDRLENASGNDLPLPEIIKLTKQIAEALDFAHDHNVIHRDLKPDNVLIDEAGNAYLSDFGIAKVIETSMTFSGTLVMDTPSYMAPEQVTGGKPSARTDVYALGAMLFELLVGHPPFEADDALALAYLHVNEPVPQLISSRPDLPAGMQAVIEKAMAKDPDRRFRSGSKLANHLIAVVEGKADLVEDEEKPSTYQAMDATMVDIPPPIHPQQEIDATMDASVTKVEETPIIPTKEPQAPPQDSHVDGPRLPPQQYQPPAPSPTPEAKPRKRGWGCWLVGVILLFAGLGGLGYLSVYTGMIPLGGFQPFAPEVVYVTEIVEREVSSEPVLTPTVTQRPTTRPTITTRSASFSTNTPVVLAAQPTPTPSDTPAVCPPTFTVNQNSICREGPSTSYKHVADVIPGDEPFITLVGRNNTDPLWLYLETLKYGYKIECWISHVSIDLQGENISCLPIISPPPTSTPTNTPIPPTP
jgi:serine/threonine-protein kinase